MGNSQPPSPFDEFGVKQDNLVLLTSISGKDELSDKYYYDPGSKRFFYQYCRFTVICVTEVTDNYLWAKDGFTNSDWIKGKQLKPVYKEGDLSEY